MATKLQADSLGRCVEQGTVDDAGQASCWPAPGSVAHRTLVASTPFVVAQQLPGLAQDFLPQRPWRQHFHTPPQA